MKVYIEVPFFLLLFAFTISGFNKTECALLGTTTPNNFTVQLEKEVQPYVSLLTMAKTLIEAFVASNFCLFLGPWSDKYGRRPVILNSLAAYVLAYAIITIVSALQDISPWYFLLGSIPICLTGGFPIILAGTICCITDSTTNENKGVRMGIFEAVTTVAPFTGTMASSFLFASTGYVFVYVVTTGCIFMSWLVMFIGIPESIARLETEGKLRNLFRLSLVADTIKTTFKKRDGFDRALLLTLASVIVIFFLASTADGSLVFLYLRNKLHWSLEKYTIFRSLRSLGWVAGSLIGGYFLHKIFRVKESYLVILGFFSLLSNILLQGLATKDWHMYLAGGLKCFGGVVSPMTRSLVSKIVPTEETGRIFSFIVMAETWSNLVGTPLYNYIYNRTLLTLPGIFNFVTAGIYTLEIILTIPVIVMQICRQDANYRNLDNNDNRSDS